MSNYFPDQGKSVSIGGDPARDRLYNIRIKMNSDPQKNPFLIHKVEEKPFDEYITHGKDNDIVGISNQLPEPVEKAIGTVFPVYKMAGNVYQNGVHADHFEEESPSLVTQDINHIIEQRHQQQADSTHVQNKGACPQVFIDREIKVPDLSKYKENNADNSHQACFSAGRHGSVLQQVARQNAQQSCADGGYGGHDSFGIMNAEVEFTGHQ